MEDLNFRKGDAKTDVFGSNRMLQPSPVEKIPDGPTTPEIAYQMVKDETFAQTQPRLNLATFVTTYMDEYATKLMNEAININYIDETEYPRIAVMNGKCINIVANLWNSPEKDTWKTGALGIGAGLIIPLSTGLISRYFTGEYRVRQFGYSSAITNMTLVVATAVTGYLAEVHWRLPFAVYLLPLISLVLSAYLKKDAASVTIKQAAAIIPPIQSTPVISGKYGIHIRHLVQLMLFYGLVTYVVLAVTFNLPFLMEAHHFSSGNSGLMISLFFLAIMAPGFMLDSLVKLLGNKTKLYSLLAIAIGLLLIWISPTEWLIVPGCILVGLGYGIIQPLIYDKTVDTAIPQKTTLALAFVMVMNYLAILLSPFITDFFQWIFHTGSQEFPFIFNLCITILIMYWAYAKKEEFLFSD